MGLLVCFQVRVLDNLFAVSTIFNYPYPWSKGTCSLLSCVVCCSRCGVLSLTLFLKECFVHKGVIVPDHLQCLLLRALHDVPSHDHLFQNEVGLVEVEDEVQLAHIAKVAVEDLDEVVDDVEHNEFVVLLLDARYEVQRGIPEQL